MIGSIPHKALLLAIEDEPIHWPQLRDELRDLELEPPSFELENILEALGEPHEY